MISSSSVLSRGSLNLSLNTAGLILQLLWVLKMLAAQPATSVTAFSVGGTLSREAMGCMCISMYHRVRIKTSAVLEKDWCLNWFWRFCADFGADPLLINTRHWNRDLSCSSYTLPSRTFTISTTLLWMLSSCFISLYCVPKPVHST